jgi:drug/metabolite transporter (DMT)-like permease
MLIQIAVLAWLFLDENLDWVEIVGLAMSAVGIFLANIRPRLKEKQTIPEEHRKE